MNAFPFLRERFFSFLIFWLENLPSPVPTGEHFSEKWGPIVAPFLPCNLFFITLITLDTIWPWASWVTIRFFRCFLSCEDFWAQWQRWGGCQEHDWEGGFGRIYDIAQDHSFFKWKKRVESWKFQESNLDMSRVKIRIVPCCSHGGFFKNEDGGPGPCWKFVNVEM